ncbi:SH3 domain-containing protein [Flavobacterium segetis]|uniref:SH3 domain-containing protein n=1 Tax=Flavobacterium segetis TaxID=271157 RepID=A0A1M5G2I0_9FLAO|nr:tetratricopeptide repeat protein [Flavobacterium segetis]SHF97651.1 SH3 domain-containing protein [Flavobacterium segetis]
MKNILFIFLLSSQIFFAQTGYEKGNALYAKGNYSEAVAAYESVLQNNQHSAELYFNLGNAYYKLNKVAPSIYYYEKALVLNPKDKESLNNLKFAHKKTIDEIKVIPKVGFAKLIRDFTGIFHYNTWGWFTVALSSLFLFLFIGYYFAQITVWKRTFFIGMFISVVILLITVSSAIFEKKYYDTEKPAIIFDEMTNLKREPRDGGKPLLVLHEGTKVYVKEIIGKWKKVQLTDGVEGWIESSAIREVK